MARYGEADSTDSTDVLCDQIAMTPRSGFGVGYCPFQPGILFQKVGFLLCLSADRPRQQYFRRTPVPDDLVLPFSRSGLATVFSRHGACSALQP